MAEETLARTHPAITVYVNNSAVALHPDRRLTHIGHPLFKSVQNKKFKA
jgi:hypothetical protein